MELLHGNLKQVYLKYLTASFGSALVVSVYSIVDAAMVGQYHGPSGAAAMAVIAPIWNILYSFGLLTGIGGSILFSTMRGTSRKSGEENEYFTAAAIFTALLSILLSFAILRFEEPLLRLFGADEVLLPLAKQYLRSVKLTVPVFLLSQLLAAFLRNDSNPGLATKAVLAGGIFNVVGDYILIFVFDLGIFGAGLATVLGACLSVIVMLSHFYSKHNTLCFVRPRKLLTKLRQIAVTGFSTFFIDIAMGILTVLFNRQIMLYLGSNALAVYGVIVNVSTFVQCCAYGVGQAAQPILSTNYGANQFGRIRTLLRYNIITAFLISALWLTLTMLLPETLIHFFMAPTPEVLALAPRIIRTYSLSFLLLPFNIYSTYYFQSLMKPGLSFIVSISRGLLLSGGFILLLPSFFGGNALWLAMPFTELLVALFVLRAMFHKAPATTNQVV